MTKMPRSFVGFSGYWQRWSVVLVLAGVSLAARGAAATNYVDQVMITPGLVGYWRFEADTQADSSVNDFKGTFFGNASVSRPGQGAPLAGLPDNRAAVLDGAGDYVITDLDTEATFPDAATIIAWVYLDILPTEARRHFTIASKNQVGNSLELVVGAGPDPDRVVFLTGANFGKTVYPNPLPTQQWLHLAGTFDQQSAFRRIYVNGTRVAGDEVRKDRVGGTTPFSIGENLVVRGQFFQGRIDEVAIFERALSDTEVQSIFKASLCPGDCNHDEQVTVDEILTMVNIALGTGDLSDCSVGDWDDDGEITIDEILTAVNNALTDCTG
jgi:hypothetical protein